MGLRFKNLERQRPAGAEMGSNRGNHGGNLGVETMDTWVDTLRGEPGPYSRGAVFFVGDGRMVTLEPEGKT